ncbi:MAG: hypothetical protein K2N78_09505 [Oscillospiraceae bacterium]|nr:hypothetical protein [Oscillospiraceae bacterium]
MQTLAHQDADGNWVLNDPPPNKALELAKCQRYQQVYSGNGMIGQAHTYSTTAAYFSIVLSTVLRGNPTISMANADIVIVTGAYAQYGVKITSFTDSRACNNCLMGNAGTAGGLTAGRDYNIYLMSGALIIDANL